MRNLQCWDSDAISFHPECIDKVDNSRLATCTRLHSPWTIIGYLSQLLCACFRKLPIVITGILSSTAEQKSSIRKEPKFI
jgi:hypothetical protein